MSTEPAAAPDGGRNKNLWNILSHYPRGRGLAGSFGERRSDRMPFTLDYDRWIHLDAEDLAETGISEAYERLAA